MIVEFSDGFDAVGWYMERMDKELGYDEIYGFYEDWSD